jgi:hypothetical protein
MWRKVAEPQVSHHVLNDSLPAVLGLEMEGLRAQGR